MIKVCEVCSNEFYAKPSHVAKGYGRFCKKSCFDSWQRLQPKGEKHHRFNSIKSNCPICGNTVTASPSRRKDGRGKYCSKECYSKGMIGLNKGRKMSEETRVKLSKMRVGELNPAYKDGTSNRAARYKGTFTNLIKQKTKERDNFACQECGETTKRLDVHHIDNNPLNANPNNLVTLCITCHNHKRKETESTHYSSYWE